MEAQKFMRIIDILKGLTKNKGRSTEFFVSELEISQIEAFFASKNPEDFTFEHPSREHQIQSSEPK